MTALSLRTKTLLPLVLAGALVSLGGVWVLQRTFQRQLTHHVDQRMLAIANAINSARNAEDPQAMARTVENLASLPEINLIVVVEADREGEQPRVIASTRPEWMGRPMSDLPYSKVQEDLIDAIEKRTINRHFHEDSVEFDVSWPLNERTVDRPHGAFLPGAIMLHLDARRVRAQVSSASWEATATLLSAVGVLTLLVWLLLERLVFMPLTRIRSAMDRRALGTVDPGLPTLADDEIGRVNETLREMLRSLDASEARLRDANDSLESQVRQRTGELERTYEQLRRADRMATVGSMAAGVAHDLNNLLLPIRGRLRVLETMDLPRQAREQLEDVGQSTRFLRELADSLRLCAMDPAGAQDARGSTDLRGWWAQVGPLLSKALASRAASAGGHRRTELLAEIPDGLPPVGVSSHRLTQAALNLVVNAGDACTGDALVRLWAEPGERGGWIRVGVTDNGPGVSPEVALRAFEPFFSTKQRGASTGLGLAIVRGVAEAAGGRVEILSPTGGGATIVMTLPVAAESATAVEGAGRARPALVSAAVSISDERLAAFASSLLTGAGLHVVRANAGEPGECRVWLTEPSAPRASVERFLNAKIGADRRAVLVIGEPPAGWPSEGVWALPADLGEESLSEALESAGVDSGQGAEEDHEEDSDHVGG